MNRVVIVPTDLTDLALAPVALAVSQRLEELGQLTEPELSFAIALGTDHEPVPGRRLELLLDLLERDADLRGWSLHWCPSGLRLQHDKHSVVLGLAPTIRDFLGKDGVR